MDMKCNHLILGLAATLALAACQKSPTDQQRDVNEAQQNAAQDTADASRKAAEKTAEARKDVNEERADAAQTEAKSRYDVAITQAEGDHKVALQKCDTMPAEQQGDCKNAADAAYDAAKTRAQQERDNAEQAAKNGTPQQP
jgi:hypothetical protein